MRLVQLSVLEDDAVDAAKGVEHAWRAGIGISRLRVTDTWRTKCASQEKLRRW